MKIPAPDRKGRSGRKSTKSPKEGEGAAFKIKLRGEHGASLSMQDLQQGLYEIARKLAPFGDYRAKWVTVYLTLIDEDGKEVRPDGQDEWILHPYKSAADEQGL